MIGFEKIYGKYMQTIILFLLRASFLVFFVMRFPFKLLGYELYPKMKKKHIFGIVVLFIGCLSFVCLEDQFIHYLNEYIFPSVQLSLQEFENIIPIKQEKNEDQPMVSDRNINNENGNSLAMPPLSYQVLKHKDNDTTLADVAGVASAKEKLNALLFYLKDPEQYTRLGARAPKGLILYGPPGTGKTLLARALAGETKTNFIAVSGASFDDHWVGVGAHRVRELFQMARKSTPVIVFIDEIDALAPSREFESSRHGGHTQTLAEVLNEMDNINKQRNTGIFIVGATNRIQDIDPALLRSGRLDWHISINLPNHSERHEIFKIHMKKIKFDPKINFENLSRITQGFSGADIENLINEATTIATLSKLPEVNDIVFQEAIVKFKKNRTNFNQGAE